MADMKAAAKGFIQNGGTNIADSLNSIELGAASSELLNTGKQAYDEFMGPDSAWGKYVAQGHGVGAPTLSFNGESFHPENNGLTYGAPSWDTVKSQIERLDNIQNGKADGYELTKIEKNYMLAMDPDAVFKDPNVQKQYIQDFENEALKYDNWNKGFEESQKQIDKWEAQSIAEQLGNNAAAGFAATAAAYQDTLYQQTGDVYDMNEISDSFSAMAKQGYSYIQLNPDLASKFSDYQKDPANFDMNTAFAGMDELNQNMAKLAFESVNSAWDTPEMKETVAKFEDPNATFADLQGNNAPLYTREGTSPDINAAEFMAKLESPTPAPTQQAKTEPAKSGPGYNGMPTNARPTQQSKPPLPKTGPGYNGMPTNARPTQQSKPPLPKTGPGYNGMPTSAYGASAYGKPLPSPTQQSKPQPSVNSTSTYIPGGAPSSVSDNYAKEIASKTAVYVPGAPSNVQEKFHPEAAATQQGRPNPYAEIDKQLADKLITQEQYDYHRTEINLKVAQDVNAGKYGSGEERVERLEAAGFDVKAGPDSGYLGVQDIMNEVYNEGKHFDIKSLADNVGKESEPDISEDEPEISDDYDMDK